MLVETQFTNLVFTSFLISTLNGIFGLISHNKRQISKYTLSLSFFEILKEKIFSLHVFYFFNEFFTRPLLLAMTVVINWKPNFTYSAEKSTLKTPLTYMIIWLDFILIMSIVLILFIFYSYKS